MSILERKGTAFEQIKVRMSGQKIQLKNGIRIYNTRFNKASLKLLILFSSIAEENREVNA